MESHAPSSSDASLPVIPIRQLAERNLMQRRHSEHQRFLPAGRQESHAAREIPRQARDERKGCPVMNRKCNTLCLPSKNFLQS
ncbi:hypothetical protein SAMN05660895_1054 [Thermoflavifilum thermophilum]|uniref:Uncharacterized protein n=1 Tax=Thermoflavifilum thermophilum TaxID=1393122 RepID=A0A1I7N9W5_9BACT|nr:hypothetical protein SAMN05660895_1054 [Thermoflavifilum thermophilum]